MKKNLLLACISFGSTAYAHAQSLARSDVEGKLNRLFLDLGIGEFTPQNYLIAVAIAFISFFIVPYVVASLNGSNREQSRLLGLQGLFAGFLVAGVFTAPFGLFIFGRAMFKAFWPTTPAAS